MFGTRAFSFVLLVALALTAQAAVYKFKGKFVERRAEWAHAHLVGDFYFYYDESSVNSTRILYEYNVSGTVYSNLFHYDDNAVYSMCTEKCTGLKIDERPDPWWFVDSVYEKVDGNTEVPGMTLYQRKSAESTSQVNKMWILEGSVAPSDGYLGRIVFFDGRDVTFSNVAMIPESDHSYDLKFVSHEDCPRPTCPIYADIVFVLDSSGSVDNVEWKQTIQFVVGVMNEFTFGEDAVAAAAVQFCGQDDGCDCKVKIQDADCKGKTRFGCDHKLKRTIPDPDLMASVKASAYSGTKAITSTNKDELIRLLNATVRDDCAHPPNNNKQCQAFGGFRGTDQALGLELAMKIFDESPRQKYSRKPDKIVIAVTDGEDKYPNATANASYRLRTEYDALVVEVGVALQCDYDKRYLKSIASQISGEPAYFDVKDYTKMASVIDNLFKPLCDSNYSSSCGPECKGFCGCGQCLCPTCDESEDVCHYIDCNVSGSFTNGCVELETTSEIENDVCNTYICNMSAPLNPETGKKGEWVDIKEDCQALKDENPGECRYVYCEVAYGGCQVAVNNSYCQEMFGDSPCVEWECTPIGEPVTDSVTGCRVKTNHTRDCEIELGVGPDQPKSACMTVQCTGATTMTTKCEDMLVDTCTGESNACHTYQCLEQTDSSYKCTDVMTIPQNDSCTTWVCDETEGWVQANVLDEVKCEAAFESNLEKYKETHPDFDMRCKIFSCDPTYSGEVEGGCKYDEKPDCSYECQLDDFRGCLQNTSQIDNEACAYGYCDAHMSDESTWITECKRSEPVNCIDPDSEAAKQAEALNLANERVCYTPICGPNAKCTVEKQAIPDNMIADNCTEPRCVRIDGTGSWMWKMVDTKVKTMCVTDDCYDRECVPDAGCVATEKCRINTTECDTYECVIEAGVPKCKHTDLRDTFLHLQCMEEVCTPDGKRIPVYLDLDTHCPNENKCEKASCVNGSCVFTPTTHSGNDLCLNYECDPKTGIWTSSPKCNDGLACTRDSCWNYGTYYECHNVTIQCNLSMEEYACFYQACRETGNSSEYKCVRKLLPNHYIDICGNCLKENPDEAGSDVSQEFDPCSIGPDAPFPLEPLAAATIALIVLGAIIAGAAVTTTSVIGTKALISRAKDANNQSAHNNPLFEGAENEMTNPAFARESSKTHM